MKALLLALGLALPALAANAQEANRGSGGVLRMLDKTDGEVEDVELATGESATFGLLEVSLGECRYPAGNPAGDAYAQLTIHYRNLPDPVFRGWMIASSPALNALDHPRYDVWVLRCITS